ncbi:MAG: GntR family transcriptional regulator [Candidatus Omnitrophota bacterium]
MDNNARLYFQISPASGVPIYRQIYDQVKIGIAMGKFVAGEFLPSIRDVSKSLEVNPMTVSKAYSSLEKSGIIEFVRGQGMRIPVKAEGAAPVDVHQERLTLLIKEVINSAQQLSLDEESVVQKLRAIWEDVHHA